MIFLKIIFYAKQNETVGQEWLKFDEYDLQNWRRILNFYFWAKGQDFNFLCLVQDSNWGFIDKFEFRNGNATWTDSSITRISCALRNFKISVLNSNKRKSSELLKSFWISIKQSRELLAYLEIVLYFQKSTSQTHKIFRSGTFPTKLCNLKTLK